MISLIPIASNLLFGSISVVGVWFSMVIVTVSRLKPFSFRSGETISFTSSANRPLSFCSSSSSIVAATALSAPSTLSSSKSFIFSSMTSCSTSFAPGLCFLRPILNRDFCCETGIVFWPSVWAAFITSSSSGGTLT